MTIPLANAVAALQKTFPCLSRRQSRQFQNLSSKISARLFETRALRKPGKSLHRESSFQMEEQPEHSSTSGIDPDTTSQVGPTHETKAKSEHHKKVGKYLDFDVMMDCFAQTIQVVETQQLYAFLRWYRTYSKWYSTVHKDEGTMEGHQPGEVKPWVLERLMGYFTGVKMTVVFYQLYQQAIRYSSAEDQTGTFDPMVFGQSVIDIGLDLGRLVGAYKILQILMKKKHEPPPAPTGPRMTGKQRTSSGKKRKATVGRMRKTTTSPSGRKTESESEAALATTI